MDKIYIKLPKKFMNQAYSLTAIQSSQHGWDRDILIKFLDSIYSCGFFIVGGDAYVKAENSFEPTCNSWFIEKQKNENLEDFLKRSKTETLTFLGYFSEEEAKKHIFIPTIVENIHFHLMNERK